MKHLAWIRSALPCLALLTGCASNSPVDAGPAPHLHGTPTWHALGKDVATPDDRLTPQARGAQLTPEPRWFLGARHGPRNLDSLPPETDGISLRISPAVLDKNLVVIGAALRSDNRPLFRYMYDHRVNVWPVLIGVWVDAKAVSAPPQPSLPAAGAPTRSLLLEKGEQRPWLLRIDSNSLLGFLPDRKPHEVTLVAILCEGPHASLPTPPANGDFPVVRSNPIRLRWTGSAWQFLK